METLELKTALDAMKSELEKKQDEKIKQLQEKAVEDTKKIAAEVSEKAAKQQTEMQDQIDQLQARLKDQASTAKKGKSFEVELEEKLVANKDSFINKKGFSSDFVMDRKAVGDMSSAASLTGSYFVNPDVRPGVVLKAYNSIHMRDLLPIGRTTSNVVRHVRDNGGEGGPATVAEGGTKPKMDRDLSIEDASVRKIATHLRLPEEMIEDIPYLTSFISNVGVEEMMAVEDSQILYGDGTGQNLSGLFTNATAFAAGSSVIGASANRFDVLRAARKQMKTLKRNPSFALVSPVDYFAMTSLKDTTNNYILQGGGNGLIPNLDGIPIIEMNQVAEGDFLLADRNCAEIDFRENVRIRMYDQDQDNAIKNLVTIVIEERIALPIYYVNGLVKGTFTAAITDLTS